MSEYLTIQRMFKANKFEIPSYQRAYSWETPQLKQFVADLLEAREKYYMGHFLFESSGDTLLVIDGQQRITTCMIFFRAVVNVLNKKNAVDFDRQIKICRSYLYDANEELPGLKTVSYDNAYFQDLIIENSEQTSATTKSQQNIKSAKSFFEKELNKLSGEDIVRIVTLLQQATVTQFIVDDKAMAAQIFAFQNDRGKSLSALEKIKSYFLLQVYLESDGALQKNIVDYIDAQFAKIYEQIVRIGTNEDEVLNYYWRSRSPDGYDSEKTLDEIKNALVPEENKGQWIKKFVSELAAAFQFVEYFEKSDNAFSVRLRQLDNLSLAYPFMIKANRLHVEFNGRVFQRLLHFLENITFRGLLRGGRAELPKRLNWHLISFCSEDSLDSTITQMVDQLRNDYGYWSFWGNREMTRLMSGYFYQNKVDNYFLWQYELYRHGKGYGGPIAVNFTDLVKDENIEHIAPLTPTDGQPVANGYGAYVDLACPENGIESGNWINGVGNLMLISGSHNKSIGNRPFDEKLASYDSLSLLKQQLEIKDFSTNNNGALIWDLNAIKKRKDALIEAALQIWSLDTI